MTEGSLLERSARYIDEGVYEGPFATNPVDASVHEIADDIVLVAGFSHIIGLRTDDGLGLFDTSLAALAGPMLASLRAWSRDRVATIVYTHGHMDHVGGARTILEESRSRGDPAPRVISHAAVPERFRRYELTDGYNAIINERQFGPRRDLGLSSGGHRFALDWIEPDETYREQLATSIGDKLVHLRHARGETDDHTYAWLPERKVACTGDLLIWVFPNAGNPQKAQRYPREWAAALREIAALEPELLVPAHGLPIEGRDRIQGVLVDTARALESLVEATLERMNGGETLDTIVHEVQVPSDLLDRPFLQPVYDEPEFVVRNIWRLYGGWYDGNPARLKPPADADLAGAVAQLAGGAPVLVAAAQRAAEAGDLRLAAQLVEWAVGVEPDDSGVHAARASIYQARRRAERSLMAKGIFGAAESESRARVELDPGAAGDNSGDVAGEG